MMIRNAPESCLAESLNDALQKSPFAALIVDTNKNSVANFVKRIPPLAYG